MTSTIAHEDWEALRDQENLRLILDDQRKVDNRISTLYRELTGLHGQRNEMERKGLRILERIKQRDSCAPRARHGQRAAELRGWVDPENNQMQGT